ncbi:TonB-linked outer membrane protein, SusC/RagA family [Tangfeifania diversioriginum]|uniref:TonB-linked outer membrane protein, SusC/RagA family n=1 Tax=Tangfeifania diversioriginum TaxID=1168035 RepID=A0A1M6J8U4_9BACT|nr:TonB-dependent receptor [Tangfeifania diversioriginum]SHJ43113.1 TonB-linked outer membrane protein, SusC/RagA family [Tangfeifania diversioriginum]
MKKVTELDGYLKIPGSKKIIRVMKITGLLLMLSVVSVFASKSYSQTKLLNLRADNATVKDVLAKIEDQSEFYFMYSSKVINADREVSVDIEDQKIDVALKQLFAGTDVDYTIRDRIIVLTTPEVFHPETRAAFQQKAVSGTVTDDTGQPLPGVTVIVKGTTQGTVTNADGNYSLSDIPDDVTLQFSFVGMRTQEIEVGDRSIINVTMSYEAIGIEEVVAVAYGTMKKKDLTGSISTISNDLIETQANSTVTRALEGAVPGIQVSAIDGQPGLDMGIRVRGLGSTTQNNSNALIVIDGVPAQGDNPLSTINPKDIASVTVLKDAASTALYGSRGSNGVVLVTTKSGKKGKTNISFQGRWGVNQIGPYKYDKMDNPADIYEYAWMGIYNDVRYGVDESNHTTGFQNPSTTHDEAATFASQHLFDYIGSTSEFERNQLGNWLLYDVPGAIYTSSGTGSSSSATMSGAYLINPDGKLNPDARLLYNDNYDKYLLQNALRQEYNLSASGGSDKMDYYLSLGYLEDPSYIRGSQFHRYNGRAKVDAQLFDWLKAGTNVAYSWRETQSPATRYGRNPGSAVANPFRFINGQNQLKQLYARDESGNYIYEDGEKVRHVNAGDSYSPLGNTAAALATTDLIYMLDNDKDITESSDIITRSYFDVQLTKDLTFTSNLGLEKYHSVRSRYWNGISGQATGTNGALGKYFTNTSVINTQQLVKYNHDWGKNHVDALLGHEFNKYNYEQLRYKTAYGLIGDDDSYANFVGRYVGGTFSNPGGTEYANAMQSFLARANYEYDNKYYLQASLRHDGSSKFKNVEDRWGTFGSLGVGWRISREGFMESTQSWLDNLKLRASAGVIGNQNGVSNYANYRTWSYGATYTESTSGTGVPASYRLTQGGVKPNITWEKSRVIDIGLEYGLLNFIHGTFDYFDKYTYDGLWAKPIATSLGQSSIQTNDAELSNKGFEMELTLDLIKNRDWFWSVTLNGTHYTTILKDIPDGVASDELDGNFIQSADAWSMAGAGGSSGGEFLRGVDKPYYNIYIYEYAGVDKNTGLPLFNHRVSSDDHADGLYSNYNVGDRVATTDYSQADKFEKGSAIPDWIGGFSTTLKYKNFDFSGVIAYQLGGKFFSNEYAYNLYHHSVMGSAISGDVIDNTFTEDNPDAKFPMVFYGASKYTSGSEIGSWAYTDMALFSASYMNLKNITLGYNLPESFLRKYRLSNMRIYVSADNLMMLSAQSGIDPRMSLVGGFGVGAYSYPSMRTISFGVNLDL